VSLDHLKGALRSKTVWWNTFLALLASLELLRPHLTTLIGLETTATILLAGSLVNLFLRVVTTTPLKDK
jgi:hypothetical protein